MQFSSILFERFEQPVEMSEKQDIYRDLNLKQIIDVIVSFGKDYDLKEFFYTPLEDINSIRYRQEILKDLQQQQIFDIVEEFTHGMLQVNRHQKMISKIDYKEYKKIWFLQMSIVYIETIQSLITTLNALDFHSDGLKLFKKYMQAYIDSDFFKKFSLEAILIQKELDSLNYNITIDGIKFSVQRYDDEEDFSKKIKNLFQKFEDDTRKKHKSEYDKNSSANHVDAKILEFVFKLYPKEFSKLDSFYQNFHDFMDKTIQRFSHEVWFYLSYIKFTKEFYEENLSFCIPRFSDDGSVDVEDGYDLSLARKLLVEKKSIVTNSYYLNDKERILIISGANQGGKSTFARMVGQINYLASLGLQVPAKRAVLCLSRHIYTHFEREEDIKNLRSKLQDDLFRIHQILSKAKQGDLLILNEIFSSTSLSDAFFLSKEIMQKIIDDDLFCVWVTFIEELSEMNDKTVSMVCEIDHNDVKNRTFKIVRKKADGLAYANSIAKKYHLSFEQIIQRISR